MLVNIRDDDTNYKTSKSDLIQAYGNFMFENVVSFGVIPFVHGSHFRMTEGTDSNSIKCRALKGFESSLGGADFFDYCQLGYIHQNHELVDFLLDSKAEIALHGLTHRYNEFGAEFSLKNINSNNIWEGKHYLELVFKKEIKSFIPPSNAITYENMVLVNESGMNLVCSANPIYKSYFDKLNFIYNKIGVVGILKKFFSTSTNNKWFSFNSGVCNINSMTFSPGMSKNDFIDKYSKHAEENGFISIATHYHALNADEEHKKEFFGIVNHFLNYDNSKMASIEDLVNYVSKK